MVGSGYLRFAVSSGCNGGCGFHHGSMLVVVHPDTHDRDGQDTLGGFAQGGYSNHLDVYLELVTVI